MNRLVIALPVLLCIAGVASSQSLADIAKNEKERRKENAEQGNKTVFEAESVGSFGHVWWRADHVAKATGGTPLVKSDSEAAPAETTRTQGGSRSKRGELPLRKSSRRRAPRFEPMRIGSSSAKSGSEAAPPTTTTKGSTTLKRGELALKKSSRRRP